MTRISDNPISTPTTTAPSGDGFQTTNNNSTLPLVIIEGQSIPIGFDGGVLDVPVMSPDDAIAILMSLQAKLGDETKQTAMEGVQANADKQKAAREEQMKKLMEAAAELAKAKESGTLQQIFGWIGVALAVVAAVAVAVATFGAAAPASALAIAGVVAAVVGATLGAATQITTSIPGAMESMGKQGSEAFMYTMMALQIACAITSIGTGAAGAVQAANSAAKTGTEAAKIAADVAVKAGRLEAAAEKVGMAAQIATGANEVASGATGIVGAKHEQNAEYAKADAAEVAKWLKAMATQDENSVEFIRALQEIQDKGWQVVVGIAKEQVELQSSLVNKFQA